MFATAGPEVPKGSWNWVARAIGWLFVALVLLLGMSTCVGLYENPHNHNSALIGWGIFATSVGAVAFTALGGVFQWAHSWRFLFSTSFRRQTLQRWGSLPRVHVVAHVVVGAFCFLLVNVFFALAIWWLGS